MEHYRKGENLKNKLTARFFNKTIRSINGNKRKLTFAVGRTPKTMGQQPSTNGFCHHETIWRVKTSKKQETSRFVNIEIRSVHGSNVQKSVWHQTRRPFSSKKQNYNFIVDHLYWYENLINFFIILDTLPVLICKFETIKLIFSSIQLALKITLEITLPVRILCRLHWECFFQWKVFWQLHYFSTRIRW